MFCKHVANVQATGRGNKADTVSLISYPGPSEKPSCSKISPGLNLPIALFSSTPLIHWTNLSSNFNKETKRGGGGEVFSHFQ